MDVIFFIYHLKLCLPPCGKLPNQLVNPDHGINVIEVVLVVLHVIVMVEIEMHIDVKVVVVMHAWTREVLGTTSNQNSVGEWVVLEEDGVDLQVEDSVLLHRQTQEDSELLQVKFWCNCLFGVIHCVE